MGVRLDRLIRSAQSDGKITDGEVDSLIAEVKANGTVSKSEKASLNKVLQVSADQFDVAAKVKLETFLRGGPPPAADPFQLMSQKLAAASAGGLTGNELAGAERDISARYGAQVAKDVLLRALGARTGDLTVDGVTWLQQRHGGMGGQVDRFQTVLQTHLKDAKLLDANFDGKLDENDKVFTVGADGKVNVQTLGAALRDRVKIGAAMVGACEDMDKAQHKFALIKDQTFNAAFWAASGNGAFTLKPGVRPSDAVKDIFAKPGLYKFECATALVIVHYKAMLDLLGPKDFDTACANLQIGPWVYESTMRSNWNVSGGETDATPERQAQLRAGDYTYFKNWDVSDAGRAAGWQGENVISLGGGKFYGHPFGISTQATIVDYLNQNRNAGSTRTAAMLELQARLDSKLLQLDATPGE